MLAMPTVPFGSAVNRNDEREIAPKRTSMHVDSNAETLLKRWYILCIVSSLFGK